MSRQKTVLITGCSEGGIGAALAHEFHRRGLRVLATARNVDKMAPLTAAGITTFALDTTSAESIAAAVERVNKETSAISTTPSSPDSSRQPGLDFLINNAGINHILPFHDMTVPQIQHLMNTNVVAVMAVTHAFLPLLIQAKGIIASVGSVNEIMAPPFQATYNASKAAIHVWGNTLRTELKPLGVRVVHINTGAVRTKLFENDAKRREHDGDADEALLPEASPYKPLEKSIREREFLKMASWVETEDYAKGVVDSLLKEEPKRTIWKGGNSFFAWVLSVFGWEGIMEGLFISQNGMGKIKQ